jgi:hypothetical protein
MELTSAGTKNENDALVTGKKICIIIIIIIISFVIDAAV